MQMQHRCCLAFLAALLCACTVTTTFYDATGEGRGSDELRMDAINCSNQSNAAYQQQLASGGRYTSSSLALSNVGVAMSVRDATFSSCMQTLGWDER